MCSESWLEMDDGAVTKPKSSQRNDGSGGSTCMGESRDSWGGGSEDGGDGDGEAMGAVGGSMNSTSMGTVLGLGRDSADLPLPLGPKLGFSALGLEGAIALE